MHARKVKLGDAMTDALEDALVKIVDIIGDDACIGVSGVLVLAEDDPLIAPVREVVDVRRP